MPREDSTDVLQRARAALDHREWGAALQVLQAADSDTPLGAEGLELLAQAAYAAGELEASVTALERLHDLHLDAEDREGAAQAAAQVALFMMLDSGLMAPVRAWLARAEHLLEGTEDTPARAWIALVRAGQTLMDGDVEGMAHWSEEAVRLGAMHDNSAAVAVGRTERARAMIFSGHLEDGLAELDDVAALLLSGSVEPLATGMMLCDLVCAAQGLALYDRVQEWTEAMDRWREGTAFGGINGRCLVHRAEVRRMRGPYDQAEEEALRACEALRPWMRREFGWPLTELGEVRLRRGDLAGAEEAFLAAHERAWEPQPGLARLRLAQGRVGEALELIT